MSNLKLTITTIAILLVIIIFNACQKNKDIVTVTPGPVTSDSVALLGQDIFNDKNLSNPMGQACATCHTAGTAFTDPNHNDTSPGAVAGLFGNRNSPTAMYAMFIPPFHYSIPDSGYIGGLFLDGRVNSLEQQAKFPFLNPIEMANTDSVMVINKIEAASYYPLYVQIYGAVTDIPTAYNNVVSAIAAFERTAQFAPFTSKFDYYLKGQATLTAQELNGLQLWNDTTRAMCGNCHLTTPDPISGKILFTDFSYNSDGVPKNPYNQFYGIPSAFNPAGTNYVDLGLGAILHDPTLYGMFRVPTLRNIAISAPYFHNGVFGTLEEVVHFYNTRDSVGSGFAPPEVAQNIDTAETGHQHLSAQEEADLVAFMKTLTDGYK